MTDRSAYIETIDESDATGNLAALYKRFANPDATVDSVMKVHSLNPESLEAHGNLYVQSMHRPSPVSRIEREMIGVVVSHANGCAYCLEHHARGLERVLPDDRKSVSHALKTGDARDLTLSEREQAIVDFADKLTRSPSYMTRADTDGLRAAGLTDREILDVTQAVAYFAYANRVVLGLGAALEGEGDEIGQWPAQQPGDKSGQNNA